MKKEYFSPKINVHLTEIDYICIEGGSDYHSGMDVDAHTRNDDFGLKNETDEWSEGLW